MLRLGWFFAFLSGAILPVFIWLLGDIFDAFRPDLDPEESRDRVRKFFVIVLGLACLLIITGTLQHSILASASSQITARIKQKYLAAILR